EQVLKRRSREMVVCGLRSSAEGYCGGPISEDRSGRLDLAGGFIDRPAQGLSLLRTRPRTVRALRSRPPSSRPIVVPPSLCLCLRFRVALCKLAWQPANRCDG